MPNFKYTISIWWQTHLRGKLKNNHNPQGVILIGVAYLLKLEVKIYTLDSCHNAISLVPQDLVYWNLIKSTLSNGSFDSLIVSIQPHYTFCP